MKVLMIAGSFPPMRCGVGDYTYELAEALARDPRLRVAVLTSRAAESLRSTASFTFFPIVEAWEWHELSKILRVIRGWAPDLVHVQDSALAYEDRQLPWLLPLFLRIAGFRVVQTWHGAHRTKALLRSGKILGYIGKAVVPGGLVTVYKDYRKDTSPVLRLAFLNKRLRFIPNATAIPAVKLNPAEREALQGQYARRGAYMIVYFGFLYPRKRVELLFQISNPNDSHLVIVGDSFSESELQFFDPPVRAELAAYRTSLRQLADTSTWKGKVTMTGFLPAADVARVLAAADAIVLPLRGGAGEWSTSLHAAQAQGTFVLTTSKKRHGYASELNTYFAGEDDSNDMRRALYTYVGRRMKRCNTLQTWDSIRDSHVDLYKTMLKARPERGAVMRIVE